MDKEMIAERIKLLGTERAFEVYSKAKALEAKGKEMVYLSMGEPDFDTPKNITEVGIKAILEGETHYTSIEGIPEFREAIVNYCKKYKNVDTNIDEIVVVPGGKPTMTYAILSLVNPGDEVIYPNPGYPIYESMIRAAGATPVALPMTEECNFSFDIKKLESLISPKTKMIIINNPANPTGGVSPYEDIKALAELAIKNDIYVLSDEIYDRLYYGNVKPVSVASIPGMKDKSIILDGFSKAYAMTGWRLGYGVMNKKIAESYNLLIANSVSCTATFTQLAGMEALLGPQDSVDSMKAEFKKRRDFFIDALNDIPGVTCKMPDGAFYAFPNIKAFGKTSLEIETHLLNDAGVACLAGTSFGEYGEGYLRLSYANSMENLEKAANRMKASLAKLL
ncbi:MAG: pyridoxal phosphate-dependent aminotransferase [Lachnospiraceae bacterium]|nr:pyridoxal phosphate-dependent aminotransferase [Lachnospiraceae bacterium]